MQNLYILIHFGILRYILVHLDTFGNYIENQYRKSHLNFRAKNHLKIYANRDVKFAFVYSQHATRQTKNGIKKAKRQGKCDNKNADDLATVCYLPKKIFSFLDNSICDGAQKRRKMQKCEEHKQLLIVLQHGLKAEKKVLRDDTFCIEARRERALELF